MADDVHRQTTLPLPPEEAFALFAEQTGRWWPTEYTWGQDAVQDVVIEARDGGRCFERGPHGFHLDWGRVLAVSAPRWLEFTWQIGPDRVPVPDPTRATEVAVEFVPAGDGGTRVTVHHRGFAHHGAAGEAYREGMGPGWEHLLARLGDIAAEDAATAG